MQTKLFSARHALTALPAALVAAALALPALAQSGGLTEEMNRGLQTSALNQVVLPHYALAEHCGATPGQLAALKRRFREGEPGLPARMPGEIFDAFFDRNLAAARAKVQAKMEGADPAARDAACAQLVLPEA